LGDLAWKIESGLAFPLGLNYEYIQKELIRVKSSLDPFTFMFYKTDKRGNGVT